MNEPLIAQYLAEAKKANIKTSKTTKQDIDDIIRECGNYPVLWAKAVKAEQLRLERNTRLTDGSLVEIFQNYRTNVDNQIAIDCPHCHKFGFLPVIYIEGTFNGISKTWVYDRHTLDFDERLKKYCKGFSARAYYVPCICENGDKQNFKGPNLWHSPEQTRFTKSRAYRDDQQGKSDLYEDLEKVRELLR